MQWVCCLESLFQTAFSLFFFLPCCVLSHSAHWRFISRCVVLLMLKTAKTSTLEGSTKRRICRLLGPLLGGARLLRVYVCRVCDCSPRTARALLAAFLERDSSICNRGGGSFSHCAGRPWCASADGLSDCQPLVLKQRETAANVGTHNAPFVFASTAATQKSNWDFCVCAQSTSRWQKPTSKDAEENKFYHGFWYNKATAHYLSLHSTGRRIQRAYYSNCKSRKTKFTLFVKSQWYSTRTDNLI